MKIANRQTETACLTDIEITKAGKVIAMCRMYWTANGGMYGYQVAAQFWTNYTDKNGYDYSEHVTGGCGFCKESQIFSQFLSKVNGSYIGGGGTASYYLSRTKYHKGGNFYRIPLSTIKRIMK